MLPSIGERTEGSPQKGVHRRGLHMGAYRRDCRGATEGLHGGATEGLQGGAT